MSKETPEKELKRLIKEQALERHDGSYQRPEPAATDRIDRYSDRLDTEGEVHGSSHQLHQDRLRQRWQCGIHGVGFMVPAPPSFKERGLLYRCSECHREGKRRWRMVNKPWTQDDEKARIAQRMKSYRARQKESE